MRSPTLRPAPCTCKIVARRRRWVGRLTGALLLFTGVTALQAETSAPQALNAVRQAVAAELSASRTDTSPWSYRDHDVQPGKDAVYLVIETPRGDLKRMLELNGAPLSPSAAEKEKERLRSFVASPEEQAHRKKNAESDDKQAREFLGMLPEAFVWTPAGETADTVTLKFHPNPDFTPPDIQSRVLAVMAGQMTIARNGNRIQSLRGTLTDDVKFGFGLFGKIDKGGTFDVERREIAPGHWQITETHVHIGGHALLFKTIGQQDDEVKTGWHPSTAPDLQAALQQIQR